MDPTDSWNNLRDLYPEKHTSWNSYSMLLDSYPRPLEDLSLKVNHAIDRVSGQYILRGGSLTLMVSFCHFGVLW